MALGFIEPLDPGLARLGLDFLLRSSFGDAIDQALRSGMKSRRRRQPSARDAFLLSGAVYRGFSYRPPGTRRSARFMACGLLVDVPAFLADISDSGTAPEHLEQRSDSHAVRASGGPQPDWVASSGPAPMSTSLARRARISIDRTLDMRALRPMRVASPTIDTFVGLTGRVLVECYPAARRRPPGSAGTSVPGEDVPRSPSIDRRRVTTDPPAVDFLNRLPQRPAGVHDARGRHLSEIFRWCRRKTAPRC